MSLSKPTHQSVFRLFAPSTIISIIALVLIYIYLGLPAALTALALIVIEMTFSFDNAIINARVLATMSPFWQRMFMTVGIIVAVFGMRVVFPIVVVMLSAGLGWGEVMNLALHHPLEYATELREAHPSIAAFGGMFLFMLCLDFFFDSSRDVRWLEAIERPMQAVGRGWLPTVFSTLLLGVLVALPFNHHPAEVLKAGIVGIVLYLIMNNLPKLFQRGVVTEKQSGKSVAQKAGLAGLTAFLYLEVLDASFSLDGVIGAFAITQNVILIAVGLGVGALWVRSFTLFMVHRKVLSAYRYLEHGAHYTIGVLAIILLAGLFYEVPEVLSGTLGVIIIIVSIVSSRHAVQE
jgi:hypothetical protein